MKAGRGCFHVSPYLSGACLLLVLGLLNLHSVFRNSNSSDFFLVWALGKYETLQQTELKNPYTPESKQNIQKVISDWALKNPEPKLGECLRQRGDMNLCATPFYFSAHFPWLCVSSYEKARSAYSFFLVCCFSLSILLAAFLFGISAGHTLFFLALCFLFFDPFLVSLSLGNSNEITLLACVIFHALQKRSSTGVGAFLEGLCLTLLTLFKPLFVFSWILILLSRGIFEDWKKTMFFLGGSLSAVLVALGTCAVYFNLQDIWMGWHTYLASLDLAYWADSLRFGNQSLMASLYSLSGKDLSWVAGSLLLVGACLLLFVLKRRFGSEGLPFPLRVWLFWLGFLGFQVLSPLLWYHYDSHLALLFFLLFASLKKGEASPSNGWRAGIFVLCWLGIASRSSWELYLDMSRVSATFQIHVAEALLYGTLLWILLGGKKPEKEEGGKKTLD